MARWVEVAKISELQDRVGICVEVGDHPLAVFSIDGTVCVIDDECPHAAGPMSEGEVEGWEVECPWHVARFDLRSGKRLCGPTEEDLTTYPVRVVDGVVEADLGG